MQKGLFIRVFAVTAGMIELIVENYEMTKTLSSSRSPLVTRVSESR